MSYEIVKALKVDNKKKEVWLKSDSNNVSPRHFHWWECTPLSKTFKEQGKVALDKEILRAYWSGEFQRTENNYEKSLQFVEKSWCNWDYTFDQPKEEREKRSKQIDEHLYECYKKYCNRDKTKHIIIYINNYDNKTLYVRKKRGRRISFTYNKENAKVFSGRLNAKRYIRRYDKNAFEIQPLYEKSMRK